MAASDEKIEDLDQKRAELEQNVERLSKALRHWQTWEAEYEGFKEEIQKLNPNASQKDIQAVANDFGGDILTSKECRDILQSAAGTHRTAAQITNILGRRIDYVQENVKTVQRQLISAESQIDAFNSIVDIQPRDEEGLPLQEITEMLDDDDNIISSEVIDTATAAPKILDTLRRSELKGILRNGVSEATIHSNDGGSGEAKANTSATLRQTSTPAEAAASASPAQAQKPKTIPRSGAEAEAIEMKANSVSTRDASAAKTVHEDVIRSLNEDLPADPTIPTNETPEESALRREMLEYNMNEIGAVVATMDFDQNIQDNVDEGSDEDGSYEDDDSDEPEDEYGRTTTRVISEEYRREMQELEARLNARAMVNVGKTMPKHTSLDQEGGLLPEEPAKRPPKPPGGKQKGVRFAENLDISEPAAPVPIPQGAAERPIADTVVERSAPASSFPALTARKKGVLRFSATRSGIGAEATSKDRSQNATSISSGPLAGMNSSLLAPASVRGTSSTSTGSPISEKFQSQPILANKLVERSAEAAEVTAPSKPDEFDPAALNRQVASEHDRLRNKFEQNGTLPVREEDEAAEDEVEEESGRKMSRFKAAKLARS